MARVFICYSQQDLNWKKRLFPHLKILARAGFISIVEVDVETGLDRRQTIVAAINEADIVVLLISKSFLGSDPIQDELVPQILKRRELMGKRIFPILVEPCDYQLYPWLGKMAVAPRDGPLSSFSDHLIEVALTEISKQIRAIAPKYPSREETKPTWKPKAPISKFTPGIDFLIVTPLKEEHDAVLARLPNYRRENPTHDDIRIYHSARLPATFPDGGIRTYSVVVVRPINMGRVEASQATSDAIRRWQPSYVLLTGIAGGLGKTALGDVLVASQVADYELQKQKPEHKEIRWQYYRADPRLLIQAQNLDPSWQRLIEVARPGEGQPSCHFGTVLTGDKVVADGSLKDMAQLIGKISGVEMEAGGVASTAAQAASKPGFLMIRAVSDLADANKDREDVDQWWTYACDVAASATIGLLRQGPIPPRRQ